MTNSAACQEFARSNKKYSWVGVQGLHMPPHKLAFTQGCVVVYGEYVVFIDPQNRVKQFDGNYGRSVCTAFSRTTTRISSTKPSWPTYYSKDICNCCKFGELGFIQWEAPFAVVGVRARGKCTGAVGPTTKYGMVCAATPTPTPSRGTTLPPPAVVLRHCGLETDFPACGFGGLTRSAAVTAMAQTPHCEQMVL